MTRRTGSRKHAHERSLPPQRRLRVGAAWFLSLYVICLMLIPANLTISALGSVGTPALIIGLACLLWWIAVRFNRSFSVPVPPQAIRRAMMIFSIAVLISYVVAMIRPIEVMEQTAADRGLLLLASWLGLVLLSADGLIGVRRLESLLRILVTAGGIVAIIGIIQFFSGLPLVDVIQIPGLTANNDLTSIYDRDGFNRAAGTSTHPIEFGVALAMVLPVGLHFALTDTHRNFFLRWFPIAAIALAVPITISRSALVGVAVALLIVIPTWSAARRRGAYVFMSAGLLVIYLAIPGMLGTLTRLFTGIADDGSARSRTDSYDIAVDFISRSPFFGRGFSTFLPQYRILDNQYLGALIEIGIVGLCALLMLIFVALTSATMARRMTSDPRTRSLAQSLMAMVAAGACCFATFDAFAFPQVANLVFLGIGCIGALLNTLRREAGSDVLSARAREDLLR